MERGWTGVAYKPLTQSDIDMYALDSDSYPPYLKELVSRRRAKVGRWILFGLCALLVIAIIVAVVLYKSKGETPSSQPSKGPKLELNDILRGKFVPRQFNGSWISDFEIYYDDATTSQPHIFDARNLSSRPFIKPLDSNVSFDPLVQTVPSRDRKYLLETSQTQFVNRYSFLAKYTVIDVESNARYPIRILGERDIRFQYGEWMQGSNSIVLVHKNDIYIRPKPDEDATIRLTKTGIEGVVYNGVPDWVYEEEILSSHQALWVSENRRYLAFATFNDTAVPVMSIPFYGRPGTLHSQYTLSWDVRYPKPGTRNPEVSVTVVDVSSNSSYTQEPVAPPPQLNETEPILSLVSWIGEQLLVIWQKRVQNHALLQICDVTTSPITCNTVLELEQRNGWYELSSAPTLPKGRTANKAPDSFLLPLSQKIGDDAFRHVARFDPVAPGAPYKKTFLSRGTYVVKDILAWDIDNGYVYFKSTSPQDPASTVIQRVKDSVDNAPHETECLSCDFHNCTTVSADISKNGSFIALSCTGPLPTRTYLVNAKDKKNLLTWEDNKPLQSMVQTLDLPKKQRMQVPLPDGLRAEVQLLIPPGADLSGKTKYPMLVNVYGGPDSNSVSSRFSLDWNTFMAANQSIIVAAIDGRGSGNRGDKTIFSIYRKLGTFEVEDQINVTRHLQNKLKFIDPNRTAIWGWSYGGYATAMALAKDKQAVFKCGMSVAPVTDWIYYDSVYTERYMGLPSENDNKAGYENAQLNNKVENIRNKKFLLIHGTLDDNVHYQQSMMLSRSLEESDILFNQQTYPDEKHGLNRLHQHLYHSLMNFLGDCFKEH